MWWPAPGRSELTAANRDHRADRHDAGLHRLADRFAPHDAGRDLLDGVQAQIEPELTRIYGRGLLMSYANTPTLLGGVRLDGRHSREGTLSFRVSPAFAFAPANLVIRRSVEPDAGNGSSILRCSSCNERSRVSLAGNPDHRP
jgi:hypothetical protein